MLPLVGVQLLAYTVESLYNMLLHLGNQVLGDRHSALRIVLVDVVLKVSKGELITVFELSVRRRLNLDCVVR